MNIVDKFKSLLLSGVIALSKAEKNALQNILNNSNPDMQIEDQVNQQEIKILSEKRFYQILNSADLYIQKRDEDKLKSILDSRGLSNVEVILENGRRSAEFKTTNGLYRYSNLLHISDINGQKELKFFINIIDHPEIKNNYNLLTNLEFFETETNFKKYEYEIIDFNGMEIINNYTIALKYIGVPISNGKNQLIASDDSIRIMKKEDLISPESINFNDHIQNKFNGID